MSRRSASLAKQGAQLRRVGGGGGGGKEMKQTEGKSGKSGWNRRKEKERGPEATVGPVNQAVRLVQHSDMDEAAQGSLSFSSFSS